MISLVWIGKNEAGKPALLKALYRLNPLLPEDGTFDSTDDYPRSAVSDYETDVAEPGAAIRLKSS